MLAITDTILTAMLFIYILDHFILTRNPLIKNLNIKFVFTLSLIILMVFNVLIDPSPPTFTIVVYCLVSVMLTFDAKRVWEDLEVIELLNKIEKENKESSDQK